VILPSLSSQSSTDKDASIAKFLNHAQKIKLSPTEEDAQIYLEQENGDVAMAVLAYCQARCKDEDNDATTKPPKMVRRL